MNRGLLVGLGALVGLGVLGLAVAGGGEVNRQLSRYFSWGELIASRVAAQLGIDNTPPLEAQQALQALVNSVLSPLRERIGRPFYVTSGYRSPALNRAIKGSSTSQHMRGEAVDFKVDGVPSHLVVAILAASGLPFDQAIWYAPDRGGHVHVSFTTRRSNRGQVLHAPASGGYVPWSPTTT